MILYTVDLEVDAAIRDDYLAWLREHVKEMLTLPGFTGAGIFARLEPAAPSGTSAIVVHYRLCDRAAFEDYLAEHAPRMREAGRTWVSRDALNRISRRRAHAQGCAGGKAIQGRLLAKP